MKAFYIIKLYRTGPNKIQSLIISHYEKSIQFYHYDDHMWDIFNSENLTDSYL